MFQGMIAVSCFHPTLSHFQQTSNCEQRLVKMVLKRIQHSSTKPARICTSLLPPQTCFFQLMQLSKAVCINHTVWVTAHKKTDLVNPRFGSVSGFGIWHLPWFLHGYYIPSGANLTGVHKMLMSRDNSKTSNIKTQFLSHHRWCVLFIWKFLWKLDLYNHAGMPNESSLAFWK